MSKPFNPSTKRDCLPAKYISSPSRLLKAITDTAGPGNFHIEMKNNMYSIVLHDNAYVKWEDVWKSLEHRSAKDKGEDEDYDSDRSKDDRPHSD
ncbi:hypothetical protein B5807_04014 [Epicoccum nigrum]|uniref:Uncharacterized protein n=1 Tax=Epicoccum nigrum TaxID=105696 RepID=A0A1Y2M6X6_EPING|nr:hypothetical protein B5807_04014 [Epicoccum nigrum]